ncbi:MAG: hypothetical protein IH623_31935 [Verrucomicrobia bacterium]|nr:hypothetical protein [Verrucomicrobiota bacterium]
MKTYPEVCARLCLPNVASATLCLTNWPRRNREFPLFDFVLPSRIGNPIKEADIFTGEPFPDAVCVEISPCRLLAPPCYKSRADFESQVDAHLALEPWKWIYCHTHNEILYPEPSDDDPLQEYLNARLVEIRAAYEREVADGVAESGALRTRTYRNSA